jgi:sugar-specific transcriptional regulator TrmB
MAVTFRFEEIGLDTRDKRVYEALVAHPRSSLRKLAADTGINRGSVYESIKNLTEQGLVGSIEVGKQRRFKEREVRAATAQQHATAYIAALPQPSEVPKQASFATFYEDHEGVAAILRDVIASCKRRKNPMYRVISTRNVRQYMYQNFPNFTQRRIAEGIKVHVIALGTGGNQDGLSERKWLPATRGEAPNCYTLIYDDKTAFITMDSANVLSAIVVNNAGVTQAQKELFDHLWSAL